MLLSDQKSFIFVANTKTASTSIESALMPWTDLHRAGSSERKHVSIRHIDALEPEFFAAAGRGPEAFFRFGVMREPVEWLGSWFRYRKGNKTASPLPKGTDFAGFWAMNDWNIRRGNGARYLQRHLFCADDGKVLTDVIIPYGALETMFAEICDLLEIEASLPRHNVSQLSDFELPAELEDEVRAHLDADYKLYNRLDAINQAGMEKLRALVRI